MLAAGAANRDRQVTSMRCLKARNPSIQEPDDIFMHSNKRFLGVEKFDDFAVQPREPAQFHRPVGIRLSALIKHKGGSVRIPVLKSE